MPLHDRKRNANARSIGPRQNGAMSRGRGTRRGFLKSGLGAGFGAFVLSRCGGMDAQGALSGGDGGTTNSCVLDPTRTQGPYWVDERLNRSDVRSDTNGKASPNPRPGLPLTLRFAVQAWSAGACTPLQGAQVDIWHCDAGGIYSDVQGSTAGQNFLRGYQVTDAEGIARFTTRRVAERAGTSVPAVYELFDDKAGLVRAMFFEGFRLLGGELAKVPVTADPLGDVERLVPVFRLFCRAYPRLAQVMFSRPFADFEPGPEELAAGKARLGSIRRVFLRSFYRRRCYLKLETAFSG